MAMLKCRIGVNAKVWVGSIITLIKGKVHGNVGV